MQGRATVIFQSSDDTYFSKKKMNFEHDLAGLNRCLDDLKLGQEAIYMRLYTRIQGEPYPADARDGDLVVMIEVPLNGD